MEGWYGVGWSTKVWSIKVLGMVENVIGAGDRSKSEHIHRLALHSTYTTFYPPPTWLDPKGILSSTSWPALSQVQSRWIRPHLDSYNKWYFETTGSLRWFVAPDVWGFPQRMCTTDIIRGSVFYYFSLIVRHLLVLLLHWRWHPHKVSGMLHYSMHPSSPELLRS